MGLFLLGFLLGGAAMFYKEEVIAFIKNIKK